MGDSVCVAFFVRRCWEAHYYSHDYGRGVIIASRTRLTHIPWRVGKGNTLCFGSGVSKAALKFELSGSGSCSSVGCERRLVGTVGAECPTTPLMHNATATDESCKPEERHEEYRIPPTTHTDASHVLESRRRCCFGVNSFLRHWLLVLAVVDLSGGSAT